MRLPLVLVFSLVLAATALAATPSLGPALPVSAPGYGPTISEKWTSSIATDGDSYFVVWNDRRRSPSDHIYGTLVSADGRVLVPAGIPFGPGYDPAVIATGDGYVVAWSGYDGYYAATYEDGALRVARIGQADSDGGAAKVATNGTTILVVYGRNVFLLDRELHVLQQMKLATRMWSSDDVAVTAIGDEYLTVVAGRDLPSPIVTQRIDAAGNLQAPQVVPGSQAASNVAIASNGSEALAVWRDRSNIAGRVIARDGSSGQTRTVGTADVTLPHPDRALYAPALAWRGGEYVMMYMRGGHDLPREMFLTRLDAAGTPAGTPVLVGKDMRAHDAPGIAVRSDGSGAAAWLDENLSVRAGFFDGLSIATAAPFGTVIHASIGAHEQLLPAAEPVNGQAVTAWLDRSIGTSDVRLSRPGMAPLLVASNTNAEWLDLAFDGSTVWVMWAGNGKLGVRRYTAALAPIDAEPRMIDPPAGASVAVAGAAGDGALVVVWRTAPLGYSTADLVATILRADGTTGVVAVSGETEGEEESAVAVWDGTRFFVGWRYHVHDMGDPPFPRPEPIRALHVTSAGETVEAAPLTLYVADTFTRALKAAPSPRGVVLAWDELPEWNRLATVTRLARYEGAAPLTPSAPLAVDGTLGDIVPLASGEVDVYWWKSNFAEASILYERLSPELESRGERLTTSPFPVSNQSVELAATVTGTGPVLLHTQVDDTVEATGISRLFVRQTPGTRRRSVR